MFVREIAVNAGKGLWGRASRVLAIFYFITGWWLVFAV